MQKTDERNAGDIVSDFIQRNRKILFIVIGVIVILVLGFIIFLSLNNHLQKKAIVEVEELNSRFSEVVFDGTNDAVIEALLADLGGFAEKKSGYAGGRAWAIIGQIYSNRKEWQQAEDAWYKAAKAASKTYLAPAAYFNAAVAAEEQGKPERAIELLESCISHKFEFPAAPRAQFSIGRLNEQLENFPAANEAYRLVLINWPNIAVWSNLAQSRITAIELR